MTPRRPPRRVSVHSAAKDNFRITRRNRQLRSSSTQDKPEARPEGSKVPWQSLPFHVWEAIFFYASFPLVSEFRPQKSIDWLCGWMRLCRALAAPAASVLYYDPPVISALSMQRLVAQLRKSPETGRKIKQWTLEATEIFSSRGQQVSIREVLALTPNLRGLALLVPLESSRWISGTTTSYLSKFIGRAIEDALSLASIISDCGISLREWTWHRVLEAKLRSLESMPDIHTMPAFLSIHTLNLYCYSHWIAKRPLLAGLECLPHLRTLNLYRCDALQELDLPILQNLTISETSTDAYDLKKYLGAKGYHLKRLRLLHNRRLNLEWLPRLKMACPKLESLEMNLLFSSMYASATDTEPQFSHLMTSDHMPSWPTSLQSINFQYLRRWDIAAAETFFHSLRDLPDLRYLRIKASIDGGWRERKAFRDHWTAKLEQTFRRESQMGQSESLGSGLCEVVEVTIDNLRPAEEQLHESDFLDDELSGDDDYLDDD